MTIVREAAHAGSWYSKNATTLLNQLNDWIEAASTTPVENARVRAIIGPHAGYSYCGATAAHAYKCIKPDQAIKRVFLLGPSHHMYIKGCAVTTADVYETPLGNLEVDKQVIAQLKEEKSLKFHDIPLDEDEEEHSLEMHLPWIVNTFARPNRSANGNTNSVVPVKIVPILVGSMNPTTAKEYGELFRKYMDNSENFFVISSDFCHWGSRFGYTYYEQSDGPIYKSIEKLDRRGMDAIETLDPATYHKYQKKYENTICGRNPISVLLHTIEHNKEAFRMTFVHYSQSSKCTKPSDSSVSYAAGVLYETLRSNHTADN